jgi:nucleoside-diphosphate-sugar epimerase
VTLGGALTGRKVLVVGGSGFIGSRLVARLVEAGVQVAALSRSAGKLQGLVAPERYRFLECDITSAEQSRRAVLGFGPEIVYFLAGHPDAAESLEQAERCLQVNVRGLLNILDAVVSAGGKLAVIGDSSKIYGNREVPYRDDTAPDPRSSYSISKIAGWEHAKLYARLYGLAVVSIRPTLIYGPGQAHNLISAVAASAARSNEEIRLAGGSQTRAPLYIDDAVDALMRVGEAGSSLAGAVINLGGPEERSVLEIARMTVQALGREVMVSEDTSQLRATETPRSVCDNAAARRLLGWEPLTSLHEGLKKTLAGALC